MAPSQSSSYFPPLDKCLAGEDNLIPWSTAYRALCELDSAVENTALEQFLTDPESINFLANALDPFLQPGSKTKSDFETKTAPIHVSQSASGDYDHEEMKTDALWLSKEVNVEELVALRVVIIEWQQRAEDQLLLQTTGNGSQTMLAPTDLGASTFGANVFSLSTSVNGDKPDMDFSKEEVRRQRQLQLYLDEKSFLLKISTDLVDRVAVSESNSTTGRTWIDELAEKVMEDQCPARNANAHEAFLTSAIDTIDRTIQRLDDSTKWPEAYQSDEAKRLMYATATFTDITSALRLLLSNFYTFNGIPGQNTASAWFKLMSRVNFFQELNASSALPDPSTIQCLTSIISVTVLQVPKVISRMQEVSPSQRDGDVQYPRLDGTPYFQNEACAREINIILYQAAAATLSVAAPAIYGWSIMTTHIRNLATFARNRREQQRITEEESSDGDIPLRRKSSRQDSKDEASTVEQLYYHLQDFELEGEVRDDPPSFFARKAVDVMNVHAVVSQIILATAGAFATTSDHYTSFIGRSTLLDLVQEGVFLVSYGEEVLEAILTLLSPDVHGRPTTLDSRLADLFLSDESTFRRSILEQALARYPFEQSPLLRLLTALESASSARAAGPTDLVQLVESFQTMTIMVPEHFRDYALDHEDENMNNMVLTQSLPLFVSKQALSFYGKDYIGRAQLTMGSGEDGHSNILAIPAGAEGVVVKESRPLVFQLDHQHSGLEYLGLFLSTALPNSELLPAPMDTMQLDCQTAADIVNCSVAQLRASMRQHQGVEEARFVLGRLSYALPDEQDIISIVAEILETELLAHLDQSIQDGSLELLIACAEFFDLLTSVSPERVWSTLARSCLLGLAGGANALAAVLGGAEVQIGRYRFLSACVKMYAHLIDDAVSGLVKRRARINKATNRFDSPMSFQDSTPERTMSAVLGAYQSVMLDAWQSLNEWRFYMPGEKSDVATLILKAFERLLRSTYGVGQDEMPEKRLSALLFPAADLLLTTLTTSSGDGLALQTFTQVFGAGSSTNNNSFRSQERQAVIGEVTTAANFLSTLLRTLRTADANSEIARALATRLLKLMPNFATLLATGHAYKCSLSNLLTQVVLAVNDTESQKDPPSLLGQLSAEAGKSFLNVVSKLDRPLRDIQIEGAMWNFLSTVISSNQQWFAIYLLTGAIPKDRLKDSKTTKSKSLLVYSLEQLSDMATLAPERAMAMLKFVAAAQGTWVWATNEVRSHPDFLKNALEWLNNLQAPSRAPNLAEEIILANEHQIAAYLCDILAVNVSSGIEIGDKTTLKLIVPKLSFLRDHAGNVDAYNRSLHRNLTENFGKKFSGCEITDFTRTAANPAPFGRQYFYDLDLANRVLGHEMAWQGAGLSIKSQGFSEEFARANVNLSLEQAQKALLQSWRVLTSALCDCIGDQNDTATLQTELAKTTERCLQANVAANLDVPGMDDVVNVRADMAFVILSRLVGVKTKDPAMRGVLSATWDLVRSSPVDYDVATAAEDLRYYRTLLQVLYLAIQPHAYMESSSTAANGSRGANATDETRVEFLDPAVAGCLVEIVNRVIAPGFRALCGNLHTSIDLAQPADFALLTGILQALLSVRGIEAVHPQIADIVASSSLVRGALSLYSWADRLAERMDDQDPIYGEVAMKFLLTLSTIPSVAEQMAATDNVLVQLSSANLSNYFRKDGGKGPFHEPRRMFAIWTEGFLPLCLNLLDAVGPVLAAEVSTFLDGFSQQLLRAETALENRTATVRNPHAGAITLGLVSEAHSLCLIALILESDVARGAAEGINAADVPKLQFNHVKVKDEAAGLVRQRTSLASRIVPVGAREEAWRARPVEGPHDNLLQAKVLAEVMGLLRSFGSEDV